MDGAMGTMLQEKGLPAGEPPELLNLTHPEWVKDIHQTYAALKVDIIATNTFGANRVKLSHYGQENKVEEINALAVRLAREVARDKILVAASIGPTGKFVEPLGDLSFDNAREVFREQIGACINAGAQLILLETFADIKEAKAAIVAARELDESLPIICTLTFQENLRTLLGTGPEEACISLEALDIDLIGANCGLGPEKIYEVFQCMKRVSRKKLAFQPNAGMPVLRDGRTYFPASPEYIADYALKFVLEGANVIGCCCGCSPAHVRAVREAVKGLSPQHRSVTPLTAVTGRTNWVGLGTGRMPVIVGERINPTGKPQLATELKEGKLDWIKKAAQDQVRHGAEILDINLGLPDIDERKLVREAVLEVQGLVDVPIMIDTSRTEVLEQGLKSAVGKPIINSVNGKPESLARILPLAKKYGAAVIGLTLDEKGIPQKAQDKLSIAHRIVETARGYGIPPQDILIDCLILAVSTEPVQVQETLNTLRMIRADLPVATILGISNVSYGLPNRSLLNASFLSMALAAGLDAAIVNPLDLLVHQTFYAASVLIGRDKQAQRYLSLPQMVTSTIKEKDVIAARPKGKGPLESLIEEDTWFREILQKVREGNTEGLISIIDQTLSDQLKSIPVINDGLIRSLEGIGRAFNNNEIFLPQLILAAQTVQKAFEYLKRIDKRENIKSLGRIILATVYGDIHDIGKNIVALILETHGFEIIDLGRNVPTAEIVAAAQKYQPLIVGLSALMTSTMQEMGKVVKAFQAAQLTSAIMVGGAVVTEDFAREIGAQIYAKDAIEAATKAKKLVAVNQ
jgi:5-methyltetrahydrofolate--homocysteine methyltransferase